MNCKYIFLILFRTIFLFLSVFSSFYCFKNFESDVLKDANKNDTNANKTELTQYTNISVSNPYLENLEIYGDDVLIASLKTNEKKQITILDQKNLTFKRGENKVIKPLKIREYPQIIVTPLREFGIDVSLRQLQDSVCFRVEIIDDFVQNLNINFEGPITSNKISQTIFEIKPDLLESEDQFKDFIKGKSAPYEVDFKILVQDKIAPHKIEEDIPFIFGKW